MAGVAESVPGATTRVTVTFAGLPFVNGDVGQDRHLSGVRAGREFRAIHRDRDGRGRGGCRSGIDGRGRQPAASVVHADDGVECDIGAGCGHRERLRRRRRGPECLSERKRSRSGRHRGRGHGQRDRHGQRAVEHAGGGRGQGDRSRVRARSEPAGVHYERLTVLPALRGTVESQFPLDGADTLKPRFVELVLETDSDCESEHCGARLKFRAIGLTTSIGFELTYMLTGMVTGLFGSAAPVEGLMPAMVTVPVQVVPETMEPGVTVIGNEVSLPTTAAVTPEESQLVPQAADVAIATVALKLACAPVLLCHADVWVVGLFCPI